MTCLQLQPAKPNKITCPDAGELYADILPEDGDHYDIPKAVWDAFDELDKKLTELNVTLSWEARKTKLSAKCVQEIQEKFDKVKANPT